jgi:CRP-like cAMP-binding protein
MPPLTIRATSSCQVPRCASMAEVSLSSRTRSTQSAAETVPRAAFTYGGGERVVVPLTQEEIASLAGTSRATVNKVLRDEERRGTIELLRGKTVVLDMDALTRRAR